MRVELVAVVGLVGALAGCERDPAEHICPDVADGGLVVTELSADDALGQWLEIYNATGVDLDLTGLVVRVRSLDGSRDDRILVRTPVSIGVDGYAVIALGTMPPATFDPDYLAGLDAGMDLPSTGAIDVDACDDIPEAQFADQRIYRTGLPGTGTASLGLVPPTADGNDMDANWCTSPTGTPGEANETCP